ncbi:uncharacterized protein zmp:0000000991 [Puntigrus tetrazona]|uniref:uncharacterized protein zmp:0000000991 n=1 Tax=Puntigrus tetrazona TaxID=1606681 RepID=UPI001C8AB0DA|nr:uncharacterized protein zmp:0000000991 [Puntigrus tetrazona]
MSTHDLKLQQSSCQSGAKASVTRVVSDLEGLHAQSDKSRFQNVSEHEKIHPGSLAQHIHHEKDSETTTTASTPTLQLTGRQKSCRDLQIRQIILLRSKEDLIRTSEEQRKSTRFTSAISISLPNRRNKKDTAEEKILQTTTNLTHEALKNTANQHHTELRDVLSQTDQCGEPTGELFKNGDGPKSSFDEYSFTTLHQRRTKQGQNTGIQHNIGLHEQIVHNNSQRHSTDPVCEVQTEFNKESGASNCRENAATAPQCHSNLTSCEVDNGLKASIDSTFFAHHLEVANQVLSLDFLPASHSENTPEPESGCINPRPAMLSSALASVLAPPWSGRLRRHKQGGYEVQHEPQDCGQNVNPSSLFCQERQQQPFLNSQRRPSEHMLANNNDMQLTAGTSYSPDWQKENNSPNITNTIQPKRPITKSYSVGILYNNTDLQPFPTPLDKRRGQNVAHSGYRISNIGDEHEPFKSLSSKPTTSSLLLSLRRSNLRNSSAEPIQSETQMNRSVRSLTLPSRVVLKTPSFAHPVNSDTQTHEYSDTPARTEEIPVSQFPFSPRIRSRVPLRASLFLNKPESEISITKAKEEHLPHSTTKTSQLGILRAQQRSYSVLLREYSSKEDIDAVDQNTANNTNLQNSIMTNQQVNPDTIISPKYSKNVNVQQSGFNVQKLKSQSTHNIITSSSSDTTTFTDRFNYSPRKDSSVDGTSPTNIYLDSKKYSQSSQSTMDLSSPLSPSRPLRSVRVPSIYSYLRESTPSPSSPSSDIQRGEASPSKQDRGVTLQADRKTLPSKFSFDFNQFVPQVQSEERSSFDSHIAPAQSLPPDFGRRSAPRLSTSPYSSLISSRPTLNNTLQELPSPTVPKTHTRSTSYGIVTTPADFIKSDPSSSLSTYASIIRPKEQFAAANREQSTAVQAYTSALDNHKPAQPCLLQTAPNTSFVMESQSANISPHPRQSNTGSNSFFPQEHDGLMELPLDKGNANLKHRLTEKGKCLLSNKLTVESQTPLTAEKKIPAVHMHEKLQEMQSSNSKKGLFSSRVKKDKEAVFSSASLPDKEVVSHQYLKTKRHPPVIRTSSRIDQMLNRLKLTFGVKRSDSSLDTLPKKNKSLTQQPSDTETFENTKTEEKTYSESHLAPSNSSLTTDKSSLGSLSQLTLNKSENALNMTGENKSKAEINYARSTQQASILSVSTDKTSFDSFLPLSPLALEKSENTLNMDWQSRFISEQKCSGCAWEVPSSSLTTNKASFASLSPITLRKSENTLNMDLQNRSTTEQKVPGYKYETPNSSLTTDKSSFGSLRSLSPLTFRKSQNTLNMNLQNRSTTEQKVSGYKYEVPNTSLTTDKSSFPSLRSLSPLTFRKSENILNMDLQNRSPTEQMGSVCTWETPNSSVSPDKASFGSLSPLIFNKSSENSLNVEQQKRHSDENGNQSYNRSFSPHRQKAQNMNRSATLPHYRKSSVGPPSPFSLFDFDSEDIQNDNVFYSPLSKKTNSLCESDDFSPQSATKSPVQQNLVRSHLSSSCADLKYGLHSGRSFSVSSVVSSRPSGPGRISTSSISDLSSLDDFVPKGNYTIVDSPMSSSQSPIYDAKSITGKQSQSEHTDLDLEHDDADPTPPPSPTTSSSPRRISQAPSVSSPIWTPENMSPPRGILLSRSHTTSMTVFEESDSDTTTDDEYYLDNGDAVETEL